MDTLASHVYEAQQPMGNGTSTEAEHDTDDGSPPRCPPPPLRIPKPHEGEGREQVVSPLPTAFTDKYEVVGEIGRGAFGCVYKVRDRRTKAVYAAKHVELNDSNRKEVRGCGSDKGGAYGVRGATGRRWGSEERYWGSWSN